MRSHSEPPEPREQRLATILTRVDVESSFSFSFVTRLEPNLRLYTRLEVGCKPVLAADSWTDYIYLGVFSLYIGRPGRIFMAGTAP